MSADNSLDFVTTDRLVAELLGRYDTMVIVGQVKRSSDAEVILCQTTGDKFAMTGLLSLASRRITALIDYEMLHGRQA